MEKQIKKKLINIVENLDELEALLADRISDLYEIKGGMQARHCYIYYRSLVWRIANDVQSIIDKEK